MYDLLDDKVLLFLDTCLAAGIRPNQFHAVFPRILTGKARDFQPHYIPRTDEFGQQYLKVKLHFEHEVHRGKYFTDWTTTTFEKLRSNYRDKSLHDILEMLLDKLQLCQRALGPRYSGDEQLHTAVINACRGVPELEYALMSPPKNCEQLFDQLRSSVEVNISRSINALVLDSNKPDDVYYVDRSFNDNGRGRGGSRGIYRTRGNLRGYTGLKGSLRGGGYSRDSFRGRVLSRGQYQGHDNGRFNLKRCFVCNKEGCWSSNHSIDEHNRAKQQYMSDTGTEMTLNMLNTLQIMKEMSLTAFSVRTKMKMMKRTAHRM